MTELMLGLLLWIGANTDYTVTTALPNIVMTEKYNMCAAYGIGEKGRCDAARLHGFYDKNMTIYLRNGFDVANADDVSCRGLRLERGHNNAAVRFMEKTYV